MAKPMQKMTCPCPECPKAGDVYVCEDCKMTIVVERDCACAEKDCVCFACCGKCMCKAN